MKQDKHPATLYGEGDRLALLKSVLEKFDHPDRSYPIIHLAGTNGKGSTGRMIGSILEESGKKVGYFMSPHLERIEETIEVQGEMISEEAYAKYAKRLKDYPLSVFEESVLVALLYFKEQAIDYLILETGLGGALDATNAIENSQYAIFTPISLDHTDLLGASLEEIALTKSGIIRPGSRVLIGEPQDKAVRQLLERRSGHLVVNQPWQLEAVDGAYLINDTFTLHLALKGAYQKLNLRTVLDWYVDYCALTQQEPSWSLVDRALSRVALPGRYEVFHHKGQTVILDAAHNPAAMRQFVDSFKVQTAGQKTALIVGFLKDKDVRKMLAILLELEDVALYLTEPAHKERALPLAELVRFVEEMDPDRSYKAVEEPKLAFQEAAAADFVGVVGSFYVLKAIRKDLHHA